MKVFKEKLESFYRANEEKYLRFIILVSVITIANIIYALFVKEHFIMLNENQILYTFSIVAQVVAALMGLIIATYGLLDSKNRPDKDDDSYEFYCAVKDKQYVALLKVSITGIITILLSLSSISLYAKNKLAFDITSSEGILLFLVVIFYVIIFATKLDPNEINKEGDKAVEEYNAGASPKAKTGSISFGMFVTEFNQLENLIKGFANEIDPTIVKMTVGSNYTRFSLRDYLNILFRYEIIDNNVIYIVNDIRKYRNALVHSSEDDKTVNEELARKLKGLFDLLNKLHTKWIELDKNIQSVHDTEEFFSLIKFAKENRLSEIDKRIVEAIENDEKISASDLNLSKYAFYEKKKELAKYVDDKKRY